MADTAPGQRPESGRQLKVFISYSRRDLAAADALVAALEAHAFAVTIDRRDLPYGEEWQAELADFIRGSDTVVWLVSPDSVASKWCNWELGEVQRLNKRLVPVRIRATEATALPEVLGRIHLLPAEGVYAPALHEPALVATLETDRTWVKESTRLSDRARQWLAKDRDSALLLRGAALADAEAWRLRQPKAAPQPGREILDLVLASRQAATRRGRYWLSGTLALLALSVGGGLWSWAQKLEADRQRTIALEQKAAAERNFNFSIDATEKLAIGLAQDLREATGVRMDRVKGILDRAEELYARLTSFTVETPRLARSQIWMLKEMAQTYRRLGDQTSARERIESAVTRARKLQEMTPPVENAKRVLAEVLIEHGNVAEFQGERDVVRASLSEAVTLLRQDSTDASGRQRLLFALQQYGLSLSGVDSKAAREALEERLQLANETALSAPEDIAALKATAHASFDLAWLAWGENDNQRARQLFESLAPIWRKIIERDPNALDSKHGLLRTLQRLADIATLGGDKQAALAAEIECLPLARALAAAQPDNYQAQIDIAFALSRLGNAKIAAGEPAGAREAIDEALSHARRLSSMDPSDAGAVEQLGNTLQWLSSNYKTLGDQDAARGAIQESVGVARKLVSMSPDDSRFESSLAFRLAAAADILPKDKAIAAVEESVTILKRLLGDGLINEKFSVTLAHYEEKLAGLRKSADAREPPQSPATAQSPQP